MKKNRNKLITKKLVEPRGYYQATFYDQNDPDRRITLTRIAVEPEELYEIKDSAGKLSGTVEIDDLPYFYADHDLQILKMKEDE